MEYVKTKRKLLQTTNRGNKIYVTCYYPKENPPNAIEDITRCMAYLGLFDDIKIEQ